MDIETCARIRAAMDAGHTDAAEILHTDVTADADVRRAASIEVDEETLALVEERLDAERQAIAATLTVRLGLREGPGFLRYGPGGFYRPHRDRAASAAWPAAARRLAAVVVFLNDDFAGGALRLLEPTPHDIEPAAGMLVAFPAGFLHEVMPVEQGSRDVIVDWFY